MTDLWARQRAAQAWCYPATSKTEMDGDLAEAFAVILQAEVKAAVRWAYEWGYEDAMSGRSGYDPQKAVARYKAKRAKGGGE